jgi:hypothetical protein
MLRFTPLILALFAACSAWLAGCTPGKCINMKDVTYKIIRQGDLVEGKPATVSVELKNRSQLFMVVQRLQADTLAPGETGMQIRPRYGSLSRTKDGLEVYHNTIAQQMTPPLFAGVIIPPGGKAPITLEITPSTEKSILTMYYRGLTVQEAAKFLFFPPQQQPGAEVKYVKIAVSDLLKASRAAPPAGVHPMLKHAVVAVDFVQATGECTAELPFAVKAQPRSVSGTSLARALGEAPAWKIYSDILGGWVAGTATDTYLFHETQPQKTVSSPAVLFSDWEKGEKVKVKIGDEGALVTGSDKAVVDRDLSFLSDMGTPSVGDGMYTQGTFIDVAPEQAGDFLKRLYDRGCSVAVVNYFQSSHFFRPSCAK